MPDHFGRVLYRAELDGDGHDDLLVGAPDYRLSRGGGYDVGRLWFWPIRSGGVLGERNRRRRRWPNRGDRTVLADRAPGPCGGIPTKTESTHCCCRLEPPEPHQRSQYQASNGLGRRSRSTVSSLSGRNTCCSRPPTAPVGSGGGSGHAARNSRPLRARPRGCCRAGTAFRRPGAPPRGRTRREGRRTAASGRPHTSARWPGPR